MKTSFLALASAALMLADSLTQISPAVPKPTLTEAKVTVVEPKLSLSADAK